jgi:tRNA 2-thiouridine synthesizing protein A
MSTRFRSAAQNSQRVKLDFYDPKRRQYVCGERQPGLQTSLAVEALLMTIGLQPDLTLDARDLFCPSPVLKAAEEIDKLVPGQLLRILANDPAAEEDIQRWAKRAGHTLLELRKEGRELTFLVRKG